MSPRVRICDRSDMTEPRTNTRLAAGRVYADVRIHAFSDAPAMALFCAGVLMLGTGGWSERDAAADSCAMCEELLRR